MMYMIPHTKKHPRLPRMSLQLIQLITQPREPPYASHLIPDSAQDIKQELAVILLCF